VVLEAFEAARLQERGVDYRDLFTDEDKFGFSLLTRGNLFEFLEFKYLSLLRDWGVEEAEEKIVQLVNIASKPKKADKRELFGGDLAQVIELAQLLKKNGEEEMRSMLKGLSGEYIPAAPGGDVIRDGVAILPTGRNINSLDPYRLPSELALVRGGEAASLIIESHRHSNGGAYPETVAVTLWGLDTIKTKGESIGILLGLVGAKPIREGTGRVVGFELIPLEQLGRPRIDVIGSLSGIFRDSFGNVLDLLDDMLTRASEANEPIDQNYIKKHTDELRAKGVARPSSRLFSNPPGDFGSMVNEKVGTGDWENGEQLGDTWESKNAWSYGRGGEKGSARPEILKNLLNSTDRIVQQVIIYT
jgi:magnesium chelatase subunit H